MGHYEPATVSQLASVIEEICNALQDGKGQPVDGPRKLALAQRIVELFENGITDPDQLRLQVMADGLWVAVRPDAPLVARAHKLARSGVCKSLLEIARRLKMEGYANSSVDAHLADRKLSIALDRVLSRADKA